MKIEPDKLTRKDRHMLMGSVVVPRPIALVSTISNDGVLNLAPYALFTLICYHPIPIVAFTPMRRLGISKKDTLVNIERTKEFVINMVTEDIAEKMNITSKVLPPEIDEFQVSGLTPIPSDLIKAPRVSESPINLECRLTEIVEFGKPNITGEMVLGEVLRVHIRDDLYRNGIVDSVSFGVIGRMGWAYYTRTSDLFEMKAPDTPEEAIGKG
jgi:flavin reductase (DIM6/NTAB) family NADH-FMN oxidoreductase RutF